MTQNTDHVSANAQNYDTEFVTDQYRPWVENYPSGISWNVPLNLEPVHERVLAACDTSPHKPALDFLGATTSYGALGKKIRAFAGALQSEYGVKKGDRVAIMLPNTPFFPIAYHAVLLVGGTVVNCNPLYTVEELSLITGDSGAEILITTDLKLLFEKAESLVKIGHVKKVIACHFPEALPLVKGVLYSLLKRKDLSNVTQSAAASQTRWFKSLVALGKTPTKVDLDLFEDVAVQQYTGGTTGEPKGALLSHANIAANVDQIDKWGCGLFYGESKVVAVLPFFHIFAMTVCMNVPLGNGIEVVMLPRFDIKSFLDLMERKKPNVLPCVPTLLRAVANNRNTTKEKIGSLEIAIAGGAPLPNEIREEFAKILPDTILAEGYGLTECSPVVCCAPTREASRDLSIGMPLPATDVRFLDLDDPTKQMPNGEPGELAVKGHQVMKGYYNNDAANEYAFIDGYFRSGDVGYADKDGFIYIIDRIKDLILCSGFNVYPRQIEDALYKHEAIDECNVIGVQDEYRGEAPIAFVKLKEGAEISTAELKSFLSEHISKIEMPKDIVFKDELPKTMIGKLSKKELRVEYEETRKAKRTKK